MNPFNFFQFPYAISFLSENFLFLQENNIKYMREQFPSKISVCQNSMNRIRSGGFEADDKY